MKYILKNRIYQVLAITFFALFFVFQTVSATVSDQLLELSKRIEELTKKEQQLKSGIASKHKEAESLTRDISLLSAQILRIQNSLSLTEKEIEVSEIQIQEVREEIFSVEDILSDRKDMMIALLRELNEVDNKNLTAILLSSDSISDFFDEVKYVSDIGGNIIVTLQELRGTKEALMKKEGFLSDKKIEAERLSVKYKSDNSALSGTKSRKNNLLVTTKGKEEEYKKMLSEVEQEKAKFFGELQQLEQNARNEGIFIVNISVPVPPKQKIYDWPESDPILTQGYGYTTYARRGAYGGAPHNGIDMASGEGTFIKSIGEGKVIAKGHNTGFGNWVAVQHMNGLVSLYAHMKLPGFLNVGTVVKARDILGSEGSTGNSTGSHLHLSIYHEFFTYINEKRDNQVYFNYFDGTLNPKNYLK